MELMEEYVAEPLVSPVPGLKRHILTEEDRLKSHAPEAVRQRRETFSSLVAAQRQNVAELREWGMVGMAISDHLGLADSTTRRYLREAARLGLVEPMPPWTTWNVPPEI
jgi:hypothetical protein